MFCPVCKTRMVFRQAVGDVDWICVCPSCGYKPKLKENDSKAVGEEIDMTFHIIDSFDGEKEN